MTRSPAPPERPDGGDAAAATDTAATPETLRPARRGGSLRRAWGMQLLGVLVALAGLTGYWLTRDAPRAVLTEGQMELLGVSAGDFTASFLVAGRDRLYYPNMSSPIYGRDGAIVGWNYGGPRSAYGTNTDTILYVQVVNDEVTMIAIPRDVYLDQWQAPVNAMYYYQGAEGLKRTVEDILGLPIDYYVIVNLDIFKNVVDALGGVEVNVPYRMRYRDIAGGLDIDLHAGPQRLSGQGAADFVRYRQTVRGDFDRIDRVKTLAYAMLQRVRELNVLAVTRLPELVDTFFADVETNATPALVRELLPRVPRLRIQAATLPVVELETTTRLYVHRPTVETFLAATFGGTARAHAEAPSAVLHVLDRSGLDGLGERYRSRLVSMGVPDDRIVVTTTSLDPAPSRIIATMPHWQDADYYADLLGLGKHSIDRIPSVGGRQVGVQLVLGEDAPDPGPDHARLAAVVAPRDAAPPTP